MQRAQRVHRVARAAAVDLERIQLRPRPVRRQTAHHFTPRLGRGRVFRQRLVRRKVGRDEQHPVEPQRIMRQLCGVQMAEMRRIERSAEYSCPHFTRTILRLSSSLD